MKVEDVHLIFVHGWLADKRIWHPVIGKIINPVSAVNFELQGFGETAGLLEICVAEDISSLHQARQLYQDLLMFELQKPDDNGQKKPIVFVSHSRGGVVVQQFLNDYGQLFNCKGWISVASNVCQITPARWWTMLAKFLTAPIVSELISIVPNVLFVLWLQLLLFVETWNSDQAIAVYSWIMHNNSILNHGISRCLIKQLKSFAWYEPADLQFEDILLQVDKRLWMVCGSRDVFYPLQNAKSILKIAKERQLDEKIRLICIQDAPHFLPLTHSKQVAQIIDDFIEELMADIEHKSE